MKLFIESNSLDIWEVIETGLYYPTVEDGGQQVQLPRELWKDEVRA